MTIKTTVKREDHKEKVYKASCKICGSEFEACEEDLIITFDRNEKCIQQIDCPECDQYGLAFKREPIPPGNE